MSHQPLPRSWVDRIFARFVAAFGVAKLVAMWPEDTHEAVKDAWGYQLGRFSPDTIRLALQATIDSGREWPPTLPEFVEQCRQCALGRAQHAPALALPMPEVSREVADENLRSIEKQIGDVKPRKGREWAQRIIDRAGAGEAVPIATLEMARRAIVVQEEAA